jgi:hypothetical protein
MEYNIDKRRYATIEGCRVLIWRRGETPRIQVESDGRCSKWVGQEPLTRRRRWQKPEFQSREG